MAAAHVLAVPELLSMILERLHDPCPLHCDILSKRRTLPSGRYAPKLATHHDPAMTIVLRVNNLWHYYASELLWAHPPDLGALMNVPEPRRQYYANHIRSLVASNEPHRFSGMPDSMHAWTCRGRKTTFEAFSKLSFPRLKALYVIVMGPRDRPSHKSRVRLIEPSLSPFAPFVVPRELIMLLSNKVEDIRVIVDQYSKVIDPNIIHKVQESRLRPWHDARWRTTFTPTTTHPGLADEVRSSLRPSNCLKYFSMAGAELLHANSHKLTNEVFGSLHLTRLEIQLGCGLNDGETQRHLLATKLPNLTVLKVDQVLAEHAPSLLCHTHKLQELSMSISCPTETDFYAHREDCLERVLDAAKSLHDLKRIRLCVIRKDNIPGDCLLTKAALLSLSVLDLRSLELGPTYTDLDTPSFMEFARTHPNMEIFQIHGIGLDMLEFVKGAKRQGVEYNTALKASRDVAQFEFPDLRDIWPGVQVGGRVMGCWDPEDCVFRCFMCSYNGCLPEATT